MHVCKFLFVFFKLFLRRGARNDSQLQHRGPLAAVRLSKAKTEEDFIRAIINGDSSSSQEHPVYILIRKAHASMHWMD